MAFEPLTVEEREELVTLAERLEASGLRVPGDLYPGPLEWMEAARKVLGDT